MNKEVCGVKVNLLSVAIAVAIYDIIQIMFSFYLKFSMIQLYDRHDIGCHLDSWAPHCVEIYFDILESVINFLLCVMLIFGTAMVSILSILTI